MTFFDDHKCWEIMNCGNLECPARLDPETPCWEIAHKSEAYHDVSNTCTDCVVYLLKDVKSASSIKKLQEVIKQKSRIKGGNTGHQVCM